MAINITDSQRTTLTQQTKRETPKQADQPPRPLPLGKPPQALRNPERIIRKSDLPRFTGLRRTTIDTLIKAGKFPRPIPLAERAVGWVESELIAWQQSRIAERDGMGGHYG
jgi:prophage regulatory protein